MLETVNIKVNFEYFR